MLLAGVVAHVAGQGGNSTVFSSGWNGEAMLPPMGWRSWNAMGACIKAGLPGDGSNCTLPDGKPPLGQVGGGRPEHHYCPKSCGSIAGAIDALTAKVYAMDGKLVSLADVGYASAGIDEGWEGCGDSLY